MLPNEVLKALRLHTIAREYNNVAQQCSESVDCLRHLLRI